MLVRKGTVNRTLLAVRIAPSLPERRNQQERPEDFLVTDVTDVTHAERRERFRATVLVMWQTSE